VPGGWSSAGHKPFPTELTEVDETLPSNLEIAKAKFSSPCSYRYSAALTRDTIGLN
jgi:hypothetical protein